MFKDSGLIGMEERTVDKKAIIMATNYGQSGRTRQEILDGYQRERNQWQAAWNEIAPLLGDAR